MTSHPWTRVLVAVDDSPAALAAVRVAVDLAALGGGRLRLVHVVQDGDVRRALSRIGHGGQTEAEREHAAASLLRHARATADRAGVPAEAVGVVGEPTGLLLAAAREWDAHVVVMGRSDLRGPGRAYVGSVTRAVLELSELPVVVVPRPG